jgi:hypothetical protein
MSSPVVAEMQQMVKLCCACAIGPNRTFHPPKLDFISARWRELRLAAFRVC